MRKRYDEVESQRRYGTAAFGFGFMRKTIGVGMPILVGSAFGGFNQERAPTTLSISPWLSFVPKEYKDDCLSYARLALEKYMGADLGDALIAKVTEEIHFAVWDNLLPLVAAVR